MSGNDGIIILEAIMIFPKPMQLGNDIGTKQTKFIHAAFCSLRKFTQDFKYVSLYFTLLNEIL